MTTVFRRRARCLAAALALLASGAAAAPERVVSMNLCTDQLALMIAAPGQLVSVSAWSRKPSASNLAAAAQALPANRGSAEQVFLMAPDLVLAGSFTDHAAVAMLRRLGVRVEVFPPAASVAEIRTRIRRIGALLGQEARAAEIVAAFDDRLDALARRAAALGRDEGAYHYPNNYTAGSGTLAAEAMDRAALDNAAAALGIAGVGRLDLETLVMLRPFLIRSEHISGAERGRSFATARHPALEGLAEAGGVTVAERWQVCGTPFLAETVEAILEAREAAD